MFRLKCRLPREQLPRKQQGGSYDSQCFGSLSSLTDNGAAEGTVFSKKVVDFILISRYCATNIHSFPNTFTVKEVRNVST